jgi:cellulose synthase/poly-beta-1,6-N-acetylglucosamine synthase-like glycosyltransferase
MSEKSVSIIIPHYNNDEKILKRVVDKAFDQEFKNKEIILVVDNPEKNINELSEKMNNKIKIIKNPKNLGLAGSLNKGIKNSKGEIIVTLLEDCVPKDSKWLSSLVGKFKDPSVVAVASKVKNDIKLFKKFDPIVKDMAQDGVEIYSPRLDEKGCAYMKKALKKIGFFDSVHFKTAGEDWDTYF